MHLFIKVSSSSRRPYCDLLNTIFATHRAAAAKEEEEGELSRLDLIAAENDRLESLMATITEDHRGRCRICVLFIKEIIFINCFLL